jgi:GNAT superfamily N-acetyltransferase/RimJ/RimL family protein N-acetyltransferase
MRLERFDPATSAGSVRLCHEIDLACAPLDAPGLPPMPYRAFAAWMIYGWTEDPSEAWLADDDAGDAFGWYLLTLPKRENLHSAYIKLQVHPSRRRGGLGTALLKHATQRARKAGRRLLAVESMEGSAGEAFALAVGAKRGLTEVHRVLRPASVPAGHLARLRQSAEPAATGYSLLSWDGPVPDDRLAAVATVYSAIGDAPRHAEEQPQVWDAERARQSNVRVAAHGARHYTVAAQRDATGELAALTEVSVHPADPEYGWQEITVVARPHRGHRLGLLVKVAMMEILAEREPQLTRIITGNAEGNEHMIAINEALGYEVLNRWLSWELDIGAEP